MGDFKSNKVSTVQEGGGGKGRAEQKVGTIATKLREQRNTSQFLKGTGEQRPPWETVVIVSLREVIINMTFETRVVCHLLT